MSDKRFSLQPAVSHDAVIELLDAYSTGELAASQVQFVQEHLTNCRDCQQFFQDVQRFHTLFFVQEQQVSRFPSLSEAVIREVQEIEEIPVAIHNFEKLPQPSQKRGLLSRTLIGIVAVLIAGLLISSYVVVSYVAPVHFGGSLYPTASPRAAVEQQATPTLQATPFLTRTLTQKEILWSLHMFDRSTGWATNQSGILRTSDGGTSWHKVSPPGDYDFGLSTVDFFSSQVAWVVAINNTTQHYSSFVTSDGGASWQSSDALASLIPLGRSVGVDSLSAISAQECWIFATLPSVKNGLGIAALHSTNSGKDWTVLPIQALTMVGNLTGSFLNSTTGWFFDQHLINPNADGLSPLFVTHDGGRSWQKQNLALPVDLLSGNFKLPTFLDAQDGFLPLTFAKTDVPASAVLIYITHDGGVNWNASSELALDGASESEASAFDFWFDTPQIWGVTEITRTSMDGKVFQDHPIVHLTWDGGQSWDRVESSALLQVIGQSDFLSPAEGWALGVPGRTLEGIPSLPQGTPGRSGGLLLKTSDGGKTWQAFPLMVY